MSHSLPWLVLTFFAMISAIGVMIYEINAKFKWKKHSSVLENEVFDLKRQVLDPVSLQKEYNSALREIEKKLTDRQFEIFILIIDGLSSKEVADKLSISSSTIDSHIKEIITNLNVERRSQFAGVLLNELKKSFEV